jgi:CRP-like cAMP-binding protein
MHESEFPHRVALVLQGRLAVLWNSPDGRRAFSGLIGPRELFGLSTLGGGPIPGDIDAITDVTLLTWISRDFREITFSDRLLAIDVLDRAVYAIQNTIQLLKVRTFTTARSRLAGLLLRFEPYCFGDAPLMSRGHLGDLAGVSVRMVSSIIRQWEGAGIVRRVGATGLELLDRDALVAKAAPYHEFPPPDPPAALTARPRQTG